MATHVSAPLPDLDLEGKVILRIDTGDAAAVITSLVIHVAQSVPELVEKISLIPPILVHAPESGTEAPGMTR